ncbi:hypothetical protein [Vulcanococcus sp. Clear-D1]|uniref:hypothetical protein n=1 Tax=Vulcanococcus sp. Clear-D1 TaxID=2766970 RepID=UPI0025DA2690|nr:hypothetical protein [Vulcanococcus sp. Clear-D1]
MNAITHSQAYTRIDWRGVNVLGGVVGTLWGLTPTPLLAFFQRITAFICSLFQRPAGCPSRLSGLPYQQDHALAAFDQGDWLAELELLQLANALQRNAISCGGYDERAFNLMFAIADVLEADHGWSFEQSDAWLERMGLWEEEF